MNSAWQGLLLYFCEGVMVTQGMIKSDKLRIQPVMTWSSTIHKQAEMTGGRATIYTDIFI